jgi:sugar lactone lactonase YvrE
MNVEIVFDARDGVGESPVWREETQSLYWVDIVGKKIRSYNIENGTNRDWSATDFPTALALEEKGEGWVIAFAGGISRWDGRDGFEPLVQPDPFSDNRLNEGKCDSRGRFWVGSMQTNLNPDGSMKEMNTHRGALFRYDGGRRYERLTAHEFGIPNTMAWSPDERYFYCADTIRNILFRYDYHPDEGLISNPTCWQLEQSSGAPDGSCIDHNGCLWNARFGGGCVLRITPQGKVDRVLRLPVSNPTSCTFGGKEGKKLFITSARFALSAEQLSRNPHEGALLAVELEIGGKPEHRFRDG